MLTAINHFFLSELLWSVTRGGYHTPINIFVMMGICIFIFRQRTIPAVLLSVSVNLFSFFVFLGLVYFLNIDYIPEHDDIYVVKNILAACFYLGAIYAILQSLFFIALRRFYTFNLDSMIIISFISNAITAWIMYRVL